MTDDHLHRDAVSERQILAMAMTADRATAERFLRLPSAVFASERHRVVAGAITRVMTESPGPIDVHRVARLVAERTSSADAADHAVRFVHDLHLNAPPLSSWDYYLDEVLKAMHIRDLVAAGHRLVQLGENAGRGAALDEVALKAREAVDAIADRSGLGVSGPPISLQELLDQEDEPHNWLVPGLLEHLDRLMLTGFEGTGKSYLLAQLALCIAAGVHPFSGALINPAGHRVLVLDCENSKPQIRRRYRKTAAVVNRIREEHGVRPADWSTMIRLEINPDGIDLGDARTRSRIEDAIAATAPDLILGGPLYKMHRANLNEETAARDLVGVLDDWRGRYGTALILEAHSGYAGEQQGGRKLRPTGSSLFLRWPEFGFGIKPFADDTDGSTPEQHPSTVQLSAWRGARDVRDWPGLLSHSDHELPWTPSDPLYRNRHGMGEFRKTLSPDAYEVR
ncbi:AAA family ATPase [Actinosynnema sp. NPDC004786]